MDIPKLFLIVLNVNFIVASFERHYVPDSIELDKNLMKNSIGTNKFKFIPKYNTENLIKNRKYFHELFKMEKLATNQTNSTALKMFPTNELIKRADNNISDSTDNTEVFSTNFQNPTRIKSKQPIYFTNPTTGIVYAIFEVGRNYSRPVGETNASTSIPIYIPKEQYDRDMRLLRLSFRRQCSRLNRTRTGIGKKQPGKKSKKVKKTRKRKQKQSDESSSGALDTIRDIFNDVYDFGDSSSDEIIKKKIIHQQSKKKIDKKFINSKIDLAPTVTSSFYQSVTVKDNLEFKTQVEKPRNLTTTTMRTYTIKPLKKPQTSNHTKLVSHKRIIVDNATPIKFTVFKKEAEPNVRTDGSSLGNKINLKIGDSNPFSSDDTTKANSSQTEAKIRLKRQVLKEPDKFVTVNPVKGEAKLKIYNSYSPDGQIISNQSSSDMEDTTKINSQSYSDIQARYNIVNLSPSNYRRPRSKIFSQSSLPMDKLKTSNQSYRELNGTFIAMRRPSRLLQSTESFSRVNETLLRVNSSSLKSSRQATTGNSYDLPLADTKENKPAAPEKTLTTEIHVASELHVADLRNSEDEFKPPASDSPQIATNDYPKQTSYEDYEYELNAVNKNGIVNKDKDTSDDDDEYLLTMDDFFEDNGSEYPDDDSLEDNDIERPKPYRTRKNPQKKKKKKPNEKPDDDDNDDSTDFMDLFRAFFLPFQQVFRRLMSPIMGNKINHKDDEEDLSSNKLRKPKFPQYTTLYNKYDDDEGGSSSWFSWFNGDADSGNVKDETKPTDEPGWFDSWFDYDERSTTTPSSGEDYDDGSWFSNWFESKSTKNAISTSPIPTTTTPVPILTIANPMKNPQKWIGILAQHIVNSTSSSTKNPILDDEEQKKQTYEKYQIWRLKPFKESQVKALEQLKHSEDGTKLQWLTGPTLRGLTDIIVPPKLLTDIQGTLNYEDIANEVIIFDVGKAIAFENLQCNATKNSLMNWNRYKNYDDIIRFVENIQVRNPNYIKLLHIGRSYEGRPLVIVKVGVKSDQKKRLKLKDKKGNENAGVFIEAGTYGREWIGPASATWIINELVKIMKSNHTTSSDDDFIKKTNWYIMPVLNPDGYQYTHEFDRFWRKSRSKNLHRPNGLLTSAMDWIQQTNSEKLCYGVDLDRNWEYGWSTGEDGAKSACNEFFIGPNAFSEPETRSLSKFLMDYRKKLKLFISLQSYGHVITYPTKVNATFNSQKMDDLLDVAMVGNDALRKSGSDSRYKIDSSNDLITAKSGTSNFFAMYEAGIPFSYTIYLGDNGVHGYLLPGSYIESTARDAFEIIKAMIDYI